jgi:hypothetical protein
MSKCYFCLGRHLKATLVSRKHMPLKFGPQKSKGSANLVYVKGRIKEMYGPIMVVQHGNAGTIRNFYDLLEETSCFNYNITLTIKVGRAHDDGGKRKCQQQS